LLVACEVAIEVVGVAEQDVIRIVSVPRASTGVDRSRLPDLRPVPRFAFPAIEKSTLANGLGVWSVRHETVSADRVPADHSSRRR